jgi:hypothetical protein
MATYNIKAKWFGWAGLGGGNAYTAPVGGVVVTATYDKALRPAPAVAQFTATVAGVARGVVSAVVGASPNDNRLTFTLAAGNLTAGQAVVITYTPGGVAATRLAYADGTELAAGTMTVVAA